MQVLLIPNQHNGNPVEEKTYNWFQNRIKFIGSKTIANNLKNELWNENGCVATYWTFPTMSSNLPWITLITSKLQNKRMTLYLTIKAVLVTFLPNLQIVLNRSNYSIKLLECLTVRVSNLPRNKCGKIRMMVV